MAAVTWGVTELSVLYVVLCLPPSLLELSYEHLLKAITVHGCENETITW